MNLKQKLKQTIKTKKSDKNLLNQISGLKSKMVQSKEFDGNAYGQLSNIEHSLYRYNSFIKNNLSNDASREAEKLSSMMNKLDSRTMVLHGGISNDIYIWRTESGACDECEALDGTIYYNEDDIPGRPHPNCKCTIEVSEEVDDSPKPEVDEEDEEPCDCVEDLDIVINELEQLLNETEILANLIETDINDIETNSVKIKNLLTDSEETLKVVGEDYGKHLQDCENNIDNLYGEIYATKAEFQTLLSDILGLMFPLVTILNVVRVFVSNYIALLHEAYVLKQVGMDKYRHSKANCEAVQQSGILGSKVATALSDLKEYYDQYTYVHTHKVTIEEAIADSERDQIANRLGRERGREYPYCSCSILMNDLKPEDKK